MVKRLLRLRRRRAVVEMAVRPAEVRPGDLLRPDAPADPQRRRVREVKRFGAPLGCVPSVTLVVLSGGHGAARLYLDDDLVTIERRGGAPPDSDQREQQ